MSDYELAKKLFKLGFYVGGSYGEPNNLNADDEYHHIEVEGIDKEKLVYHTLGCLGYEWNYDVFELYKGNELVAVKVFKCSSSFSSHSERTSILNLTSKPLKAKIVKGGRYTVPAEVGYRIEQRSSEKWIEIPPIEEDKKKEVLEILKKLR